MYNQLVLQIKDLEKSYGKFMALKGINLTITNGILGLLGPNGAGKSTLMKIIATIAKQSSGQVLYKGSDISTDKNSIRIELGYLPQDFGVYPNLNADEFLLYMATIKGIPKDIAKERIENLLELVNLKFARHKFLKDYSGGMRQRVGIAQALLNDPKILIVDEPTVGLDPEERRNFRQLLAELAEDRIIILSTHIVGDIEAAATEIAIINKGNLVIFDKPENLLKAVEGKVFEIVRSADELIEIRKQYHISSTIRKSDGIHAKLVGEAPEDAIPIEATLEEAYLYQIVKHRKSLEMVN